MASTTATFPRRAGVRVPRNAAAPWRHVDVTLLVTTLAVAGLGLLMVYSASHHKLIEQGRDPNYFLMRQAVWVAIGVAVMALVAMVDYRVLRELAPFLFVVTALVLLAVLSPAGSSTNGAQAWFQVGQFQLEPSEWSKLALIVCVAAYGATHRGDLDVQRLLVVLVVAAIPMALIYLQPDLGTDLVFATILMGMLLVAGARPRHIAVLTVLGIGACVLVLQLGVLKQYQLDRLTGFLDPPAQAATGRSAYNLNQSKTAIANGGLSGRGLFQGSQTNLSFVPNQETDFVFTVVGEELGFAGAATLLALFALLVWRTWRSAALARDLFGTLLCVGVLTMLVFQVFENVGMTMGIMPITGIPLPFMSYGGSSTIASFAGIGLVLNVHMRRFL